MDKNSFINSIKEGALKGYAEYRILPSLTIAQAILESGWGTSQLAVKANNLFGIKAFANWTGQRITFPTVEYYNNERTVVNAEFRAYGSLNDSIEDHSGLLANARYKPVRECTDYKTACQRIRECGYATDPSYPEKLMRIIEENKLYEYDCTADVPEVAVSIDDETVRRFQVLCNKLNIKDDEGKCLVEDNILGPRTRSCIARMPLLKMGSNGLAVEFVQGVVNAEPIDGIFGPITHQRVMNYQMNKNITSDGIVGRQTWGVMINT